MRGACKAKLVADPALCLVGVALHKVRDRVLGTPAVHDLLRRVVRVHDVGPRHVPEIFAPLQPFHGLADLERKNSLISFRVFRKNEQI